MKRSLDLAVSVIGLAVLWPILLLVAAAIKLDSRGPAVFSQVRAGRDGAPFRCHKFRSMYIETPERPTHESVASDITPVGRWLRRSKLDELPQLVNVVAGEMSLVGPRPCLPSQEELVEARRARGVLAMRPGITGLAQVNRIDMSNPEWLATVDAEYAERQSFWFDLRLILATLPFCSRCAPPVRST